MPCDICRRQTTLNMTINIEDPHRQERRGSTTNCGVYNDNSFPTMTNLTVKAFGGSSSIGVENLTGGTFSINNSVIKGSSNTIYNDSGVTTLVGNTKLDGGTVSNSGMLTCVGAYDDSYAALD